MTRSPTGAHTWLVLSKAARSFADRANESIAHTGLGTTDFAILEALLHKGPMPVNTIGKKLLLTSGSITTAVDRLVAKGLVARNDHPDDRRIRVVELTKAGRQLIEPAYARHEKDLEQVASALTGAERTTLVNLLRKLGTSATGER
ncbi:MAG TPA: MarR family transcriptional regulator [Gemmatimonadaceae bacterium]|jgi:MarR family 2-MHQ and catechol resistance regulon transcriptional repressor